MAVQFNSVGGAYRKFVLLGLLDQVMFVSGVCTNLELECTVGDDCLWGHGQSIFLAFDINWPLPLRVLSQLDTSYGAQFALTSTLGRGAYMHRAFVPRKIIFIRVLKDENLPVIYWSYCYMIYTRMYCDANWQYISDRTGYKREH